MREFLEGIGHTKRRRDAETLLALMGRVTGEKPECGEASSDSGSITTSTPAVGRAIGAAGFSPRKAATTVYLPDGVGAHTDLLERLGPHTTGVGCLYIKDLEVVDLRVLETIVARSYASVNAGTYTLRAREGGHQK